MVTFSEFCRAISGQKYSVFRAICEADKPVTCESVHKDSGVSLATVRSSLTVFTIAGLVDRDTPEGQPAGRGRRPFRYTTKPEIKQWWDATRRIFGEDSHVEPQAAE